MREIKFRAWDKRQKIKGTSIGLLGVFEVVLIEYISQTVVARNFERISFDDVVLMQYTGLKDKNGVEIYEGDVVYHEANPPEFPDTQVVVEWNVNGHWHFKRTPKTFVFGTDFPSWESEVIGNIYEHPELLTNN